MTIHMSARVAWHMDGWNGHVCQNPAANTYCVGTHSYPGEMIAERRNLPLEIADSGKCCTKIKHTPACCYSHPPTSAANPWLTRTMAAG